MEEGSKEKGLKSHTVVLMIVVALFFDILQWVLAFIFMDWLAGVFAFLTFYVWFRLHGIRFMRLKRIMAMGGATLIEVIPWLAALPAWTAAVAYIALDAKIKEKIPLAGGKILPFKPKGASSSQSTENDIGKAA